jgi:hypothetical protein
MAITGTKWERPEPVAPKGEHRRMLRPYLSYYEFYARRDPSIQIERRA